MTPREPIVAESQPHSEGALGSTVGAAIGDRNGGPCLHLDTETRLNAASRLKSVRGHVEGVLRMLENEDVYCVDVLKQVSAVQGGLRKVSEAVLRAHMRDHVATAALRGDTDVLVDELMEALKYRS